MQGSFTFQVGTNANATAPDVQALAGNLLRKNTGSEVVGVIYGVARWIVFLGLALLIGAGAFVMFLWPSGVASRRVRLLAWAGWAAVFVATAASLLLEGPYGAGLGVSAAWKPSVIGDVLATHFGHVLSTRLVLLVVAFPLLVVWFRRRDDETAAVRGRWRAAAVVLAAAILLTVSLAGHTDVGSYSRIAFVADWVHISSMAVWLGGLVVLVVAVLVPRNLDVQRSVLPRFSQVALVCICTLIASGAYATWRQVGGFEALKQTDYGQLLVIKLAIFALLLLLAIRSREITNYVFGHPMLAPAAPPVPVISGGADDTHAEGVSSGAPVMTADASDDGSDEAPDEIDEIDEDDERRLLRRTVGFEVALALVILAVSAMLVNAATGPQRPENAGLRRGGVERHPEIRPGVGRRDHRTRSDRPQCRPRQHAPRLGWHHDPARFRAHPRPALQGHRSAEGAAHQGRPRPLPLDRVRNPVGRQLAGHRPRPRQPTR